MSVRERISLREANQSSSRYVAAVERGEEFVITRRGRPVAKLIPVDRERTMTGEESAALARTLERMRRGYSLGGGRFSREDLYER
jgi:prevent-host-death family protein